MGRKLSRPLVVLFATVSGLPCWAQDLALDLSSESQSVTVKNYMLGGQGSVTIQNGSSTLEVTDGTVLTAAQYVALTQVLAGGVSNQSLHLDTNGTAVGGSFNIGSVSSGTISSLTIPSNVTAIHQSAGNILNIAGALNTSGTLFGYSTVGNLVGIQAGSVLVGAGGAITTQVPTSLQNLISAGPTNLIINSFSNITNFGTISSSGGLDVRAAGTITNNAGAVMSAVNNLNLLTGAGVINNSGLIASAMANINLNTFSGKDLVLNNIGGQMQALAGLINIREGASAGKALTDIFGGSLAAPIINILAGEGRALVNVQELIGTVNVCAGELHLVVQSDDGQLQIGELHITGDPTIVSSGLTPINLTSSIFTNGESLTILSRTDILASPGVIISTSSTNGQSGDLTIAAGYDFTPVLDDSNHAIPGQFVILGPSQAGGDVILGAANQTPVSLRANSPGTQGQNGGRIQVYAHGGELNAGEIAIYGNIQAKSMTGNGGSVTMIAQSGGPLWATNFDTRSFAANGIEGPVSLKIDEPLVAPQTRIDNGRIVQGGFFAAPPQQQAGSQTEQTSGVGQKVIVPPIENLGNATFPSSSTTAVDKVNIGIALPQGPSVPSGDDGSDGHHPSGGIAGGGAGGGPVRGDDGPDGGSGVSRPFQGDVDTDGIGLVRNLGNSGGDDGPGQSSQGQSNGQGQSQGQGRGLIPASATQTVASATGSSRSGAGSRSDNSSLAAPSIGPRGDGGGFINVTPNQVRMTLVTRANQILSGNLGGRGTTLMASEGTQLTSNQGVVILHAGRLHADTGRAGTTIVAGSARVSIGPESAAVVSQSDSGRGLIVVQAVGGEGMSPVEVEVRGRRVALAAGEELTFASDDVSEEDMIDASGQSVPISAGITRYNNRRVVKREFPVDQFMEQELLPAARSMNLMASTRSDRGRMLSHVTIAARRQNPAYEPSSSDALAGASETSHQPGQLELYAEAASSFRRAAPDRIELAAGALILRAPENFVVETSSGTVYADAGALVCVETREGVSRVRALSGPGDVRIVADGWHADVAPGQEVSLARRHLRRAEMTPADGLGRRATRSFSAGEIRGAISDFSIASMLHHDDRLRTFVDGNDDLFAGLLKTAVAIEMVTAGRGKYTVTPETTASAAEPEYKLAEHN